MSGEYRPVTPDSVPESRDSRLAACFVSLADTLVDDFDVVELLHGLVTTCVELLDVAAAGLLLTDQRGDLQLIASSSEATRLVELYQLESHEGPCLEAVRTGRAVALSSGDEGWQRWPRFAASSESVGFRSVHACPLRLRTETIGALNLFGTASAPMPAADLAIAQALADVATIGILQQRSLHRASLLTEQLQTALNKRIVIEQAKGVLAEFAQSDMGTAFEVLRAFARRNSAKIDAVAVRLVIRDLSPHDVLEPRAD